MFVARYCYFFKTYLLILWCIYEPQVEAIAPTFLVPIASTAPRDVNENSAKDVSILTVEGQDGDGDTLTFSIFSQNPMSPPFELESTTGLFKTPNGLDAETAQSFTFVFSVSDGPNSVDSVPFTVNINDLNDNTPQFVGTPYTASLLDSVSNGTSVFSVSATDADVTPARITYSITGGNTNNTFAIIDPNSGIITVATSANLMGGSSFTLDVQAFDGKNSNTTTVTITVNEDFCTPSPCENSGTCTLTGSSYNCSCSDGFIGQNCSQVDYCFGGPCVNGTCINGNTNYSCNCNPGYIGTNCSIVDYCYGGPCVNGVCINGDTNYTCNCSAGFIGVNCSQVDYCVPNPCQNGGICTNGATTHTCTCPAGFTGTNCTETDFCASNPCKNGGICANGQNSYICYCKDDYRGIKCEICQVELCQRCCKCICQNCCGCILCCVLCLILSIGVSVACVIAATYILHRKNIINICKIKEICQNPNGKSKQGNNSNDKKDLNRIFSSFPSLITNSVAATEEASITGQSTGSTPPISTAGPNPSVTDERKAGTNENLPPRRLEPLSRKEMKQ